MAKAEWVTFPQERIWCLQRIGNQMCVNNAVVLPRRKVEEKSIKVQECVDRSIASRHEVILLLSVGRHQL